MNTNISFNFQFRYFIILSYKYFYFKFNTFIIDNSVIASYIVKENFKQNWNFIGLDYKDDFVDYFNFKENHYTFKFKLD